MLRVTLKAEVVGGLLSSISVPNWNIVETYKTWHSRDFGEVHYLGWLKEKGDWEREPDVNDMLHKCDRA